MEHCRLLQVLCLDTYVKFLEEECAAYVSLTNLNSVIWNPVKDVLLRRLKEHFNSVVQGRMSGFIRGCIISKLIEKCTAGRYPSQRYRNSYNYNDHRVHTSDDEDGITRELEQIRLHSRKCCSPCCTGAFIIETMLAVVLNEDVLELRFPDNIKSSIYKDKPIKDFLFFDIPSVLVHYNKALSKAGDNVTPALHKLTFGLNNLGSLDTQRTYGSILKLYPETRRYMDFSWRFSEREAKPITEFLMLTLSNLFARRKNYFGYLTEVRLNGECLNTRLATFGKSGGHAAIQLLSGLGYTCPSLEILDLTQVSSLSPESLIYLVYPDTFHLLHKYMYLPGTSYHEGNIYHEPHDYDAVRKHDGTRYCPWCDDPWLVKGVRAGCNQDISETVHVLDDRLYEFIERRFTCESERQHLSGDLKNLHAKSFLMYCVKIGDLVRCFEDPGCVLDRPAGPAPWEEDFRFPLGECGIPIKDGEEDDEAYFYPPVDVKYSRQETPIEVLCKNWLCDSLKELRLPLDAVDSKAWVLPLLLRVCPNITSFGECLVYEGIRLTEELPRLESVKETKLEEIFLSFEDFSNYRVHQKFVKRMTSLDTKRYHWKQFLDYNNFKFQSFRNWMATDLNEVLSSDTLFDVIDRWKQQIATVVKTCPRLKTLKLTIQPGLLLDRDTNVWEPLASLPDLTELQVFFSGWTPDVIGLLGVIGHKITVLRLSLGSSNSTRKDPMASKPTTDFVNVVPVLCPNVQRLFLGYIQSDCAHTLSPDRPPMRDPQTWFSSSSYSQLTHFEADGNMTLLAFTFLWEHAKSLKELRVNGMIVSEESSPAQEVSFGFNRITYFFNLNPMRSLEVFEVPLTLPNISAAKEFLSRLDHSPIRSISQLTVKVFIPESVHSGESIGDLVAMVLRDMVEFKLFCKKMEGEKNCDINWTWKREGILTMLLQQQVMSSVAELIDP